MKRHCCAIVIAMMFVGLALAGCTKPTPAPAATAVGRSTPTAAVQVTAKGFTPGAVCMVPNVVGLDQGAAEGMLIKLGLQPVITNQYDANAAAGIVLAQKPPPNTRLEPCKGDVVLTISLGPTPKPTAPPPTPTPPATATPKATSSPTASPLPTRTPTVTPLPTPSNRIFFDDFETGIQPMWNMRGNYGLVNGDLVVAGAHVEGSVGDKTWADYEITLDIASVDNFELAIRIQDADNYMRFRWWYDNGAYFNWAKMVGGKEMQIPASGVKVWACCTYPSNRNVRIEIRGGNYRVFINGDQLLSFIDPTFATGGLSFKSKGITLRSFEVRSLK